jgi:hypothetical protein
MNGRGRGARGCGIRGRELRRRERAELRLSGGIARDRRRPGRAVEPPRDRLHEAGARLPGKVGDANGHEDVSVYGNGLGRRLTMSCLRSCE